MMDNREFNINGKTKGALRLALLLLLDSDYEEGKTYQEEDRCHKAGAYSFCKEKGFILHHYKSNTSTAFVDRLGNPKKMGAEELTDILWEWLSSKQAKTVTYKKKPWEGSMKDSDISEERGWKAYTEDWGHLKDTNGISTDHSTIGAIKPVYLWYGK